MGHLIELKFSFVKFFDKNFQTNTSRKVKTTIISFMEQIYQPYNYDEATVLSTNAFV